MEKIRPEQSDLAFMKDQLRRLNHPPYLNLFNNLHLNGLPYPLLNAIDRLYSAHSQHHQTQFVRLQTEAFLSTHIRHLVDNLLRATTNEGAKTAIAAFLEGYPDSNSAVNEKISTRNGLGEPSTSATSLSFQQSPARPPFRSSQPSSLQTPKSYSLGSTSGTTHLIKDMKQIIKEEVKHNLYLNRHEFVNTFFDDVPGLVRLAEKVANAIPRTPLPKATGEAFMLSWLCSTIHSIKKTALQILNSEKSEIKSAIANCYTYAASNKPLPGSLNKCRLDFGLSTTATQASSTDILVVGELKASGARDGMESLEDLTKYVHALSSSNPHRRFFHGFTLCEYVLRLYFFDRGAAISSIPYQLNDAEDLKVFIKVMLGYMGMGTTRLGFDPGVTRDGLKEYITITKLSDEKVYLDSLLYAELHLFGRATACWKGLYKSTECVVKESWIYNESNEASLFDILDKSPRKPLNVAKCIYSETVFVDSTPDDLWHSARRGIQLFFSEKAKVSSKKPTIRNLYCPRIYTTTTKTESLSPKESSPELEIADHEKAYNRFRKRFVFTPIGVPIFLPLEQKERIRPQLTLSALEILRTSHGAILGHQQLYACQILHRDISALNILYNPATRSGFLIDLDHAIHPSLTRACQNPQHTRTGTKTFMAFAILQDDETIHTVYHDLESFFWVFFWLLHPENSLHSWNYRLHSDLGDTKYTLLYNDSKWTKHLETLQQDLLCFRSSEYNLLVCLLNAFRRELTVMADRAMAVREPDGPNVEQWDWAYARVLKLFEIQIEKVEVLGKDQREAV